MGIFHCHVSLLEGIKKTRGVWHWRDPIKFQSIDSVRIDLETRISLQTWHRGGRQPTPLPSTHPPRKQGFNFRPKIKGNQWLFISPDHKAKKLNPFDVVTHCFIEIRLYLTRKKNQSNAPMESRVKAPTKNDGWNPWKFWLVHFGSLPFFVANFEIPSIIHIIYSRNIPSKYYASTVYFPCYHRVTFFVSSNETISPQQKKQT